MNSRYKFRAWDDEEKTMIEWNDTFFSDMSPVTRWSSNFSYIDIPLMQFTGLQDSLNNDIYESDLFKDEYTENIYEVKFGEHLTSTDYYASSAYGWYGVAENGDEYSLVQTMGDIEVIGNIYEEGAE